MLLILLSIPYLDSDLDDTRIAFHSLVCVLLVLCIALFLILGKLLPERGEDAVQCRQAST